MKSLRKFFWLISKTYPNDKTKLYLKHSSSIASIARERLCIGSIWVCGGDPFKRWRVLHNLKLSCSLSCPSHSTAPCHLYLIEEVSTQTQIGPTHSLSLAVREILLLYIFSLTGFIMSKL